MVWSAEELPGFIQAIITIFEDYWFKNESRNTIVSFEARKGTCPLLLSRARMHSFSARRLLLISAPSSLRYRLFDCVSWARSDPAKSTISNLPRPLPCWSLTLIWHIACDLLDVSFAAVLWVVLSLCPNSIISFISASELANRSSSPETWIFEFASSWMTNFFFPLSKSETFPPYISKNDIKN